MPGQKISSMTLVRDLQDIDQFPIARNGSTYKIAGASLASRVQLESLSAVIAEAFSSGSIAQNSTALLANLSSSVIFNPDFPLHGQVLTYDDSTETWVASASPGKNILPGGLDVAPYYILTYDPTTTSWVASAAPAGAGEVVIKGDGAPIGSVMFFAASSAPPGWIECAGQSLHKDTFIDLWKVIKYTHGYSAEGSYFNVPDLRGEFVRGWDHTRGIDNERTFGTHQKGSIAGDTSRIILSGVPLTETKQVLGFDSDVGNDYVGLQLPPLSSANYNMVIVNEDEPTNLPTLSAFLGVSRPRNVALLPCIKYAHYEGLNVLGLSAQEIIETVIGLSAYSLGTNQSWIELSASRLCGVTYTNTTLKPICVQVYYHSITRPLAGESSAVLSLSTINVDTKVTVYGSFGVGGISSNNLNFIVPPFWSYKVNTYSGDVNSWIELR